MKRTRLLLAGDNSDALVREHVRFASESIQQALMVCRQEARSGGGSYRLRQVERDLSRVASALGNVRRLGSLSDRDDPDLNDVARQRWQDQRLTKQPEPVPEPEEEFLEDEGDEEPLEPWQKSEPADEGE